MDGPAQQQSGHLQVHLCGCAEWRRGETQKACEEEEEGPTTQAHLRGGTVGADQPQGKIPDMLGVVLPCTEKQIQ